MKTKLNIMSAILYSMAIIIGFHLLGISIKEAMIASQGIESSADVLISDNELNIEKNKAIRAIWRCDYE